MPESGRKPVAKAGWSNHPRPELPEPRQQLHATAAPVHAPAAASEDGEPARGGGAGPRTAQTTGYPAGNRLMGPRTVPSNYSVAAEQPSQLPAPARAPAPQLAEGGAAEQGWGGSGGLAANRWAAASEARLD